MLEINFEVFGLAVGGKTPRESTMEHGGSRAEKALVGKTVTIVDPAYLQKTQHLRTALCTPPAKLIGLLAGLAAPR